MSRHEYGEPINFQSKSGETALKRNKPSQLARELINRNILSGNIFDWGCGHGRDLEYYRSLGFHAEGWDPVHHPENDPASYDPGSFDWICCAYVINTIPTHAERINILSDILHFLPTGGHLALSVRTVDQLADRIKPYWQKYRDGWLTSRGTFQKGFEAEEIAKLVSKVFPHVAILSRDPLIVICEK